MSLQRIVLTIALAVAAFFAWKHWSTPASDGPARIAGIDRTPIPKAEFYGIWREVALGGCADALERHNLAPDACQGYIRDKHDYCVAATGASAPERIASKAESRRLARPYLDCVTPGVYCRGVEVRDMAEASQHCRE